MVRRNSRTVKNRTYNKGVKLKANMKLIDKDNILSKVSYTTNKIIKNEQEICIDCIMQDLLEKITTKEILFALANESTPGGIKQILVAALWDCVHH